MTEIEPAEAKSKGRRPGDKFVIPDGWVARAFKFEVEWPTDPGLVRSHFGARRVAFNWALAHVKANMDTHNLDPEHVSTALNLYALRK